MRCRKRDWPVETVLWCSAWGNSTVSSESLPSCHSVCSPPKHLYVPYDYDDDDNETDDENDDDGDDAEGHLHAGNGGAAHGNTISGTLYRQQFTDTHFW